jgi:hypothetical protein
LTGRIIGRVLRDFLTCGYCPPGTARKVPGQRSPYGPAAAQASSFFAFVALSRVLARTYKRDKDGKFSSTGGGPGSGQDLIGDGDGAQLAEHVDARAKETAYPSRNGSTAGPNGDEQLSAIAEQQNFGGKPTVVSRAEMDQLVAEGHTELFRGTRGGFGVREGGDPSNADDDIEVTPAQIHERMRSGPPFYGNGQFGNGVYAGPSQERSSTYSNNEPGSVARLTLHKDAKVLRLPNGFESSDFVAEHRAFVATLEPGSAPRRVYSDPGRYAAARGYDAISLEYPDPGPGRTNYSEVIVLNRTAMIVQEADS